MDKVTRQRPQTTTFLKRKESRSGIEPRVLPLTSLTPGMLARVPLLIERVVVVVVRELFSLMTSAICVWIRGHRSEVTKIVYHMTHVFRLLLRSHHSEFVGTI